MDCDKCESVLMDELYGELDELTSAAVNRHIAGCAACAALFEGLRATRRVAVIPVVDPPFDLESRILSAAYAAPMAVPLRRRAARVVSVAGRWAMRPQTAMAAVFLVMIGTSGLLLRGKSSRAPASSAVTVTEEGTPAPAMASAAPREPSPSTVVTAMPAASSRSLLGAGTHPSGSGALASNGGGPPEMDLHPTRAASKPAPLPATGRPSGPADEERFRQTTDDRFAHAPLAAAPAAPAAAAGAARGEGVAKAEAAPPDSLFDSAMTAYRARRFDEAARGFDALSTDANADLWAARALRNGRGCRAAASRFDEVAARAAGDRTGWDAALEGAHCYRALGDAAGARARLLPLLDVPEFADRARAELATLPGASPASRAAAAAAAPPPPAAAAPSPHP